MHKITQCDEIRQLAGQPRRVRRRCAETGPRRRQPASAPVRQPDVHPQAAKPRVAHADDRHRRALQGMAATADRHRLRRARRRIPLRHSSVWRKSRPSSTRSDTAARATGPPAGSCWGARRGARRGAPRRPARPRTCMCARCTGTGAGSCTRARRRRPGDGAGRDRNRSTNGGNARQPPPRIRENNLPDMPLSLPVQVS